MTPEDRMIGRTLSKYRVEETLGKGGMGVVYRARDLRLDRSVALKLLPPELVRNDERRRRFEREARAASAVNHPAIAQIYAIEDEDDLTFIVMEYIDGTTVRHLAGSGQLDTVTTIEIGVQVAEALARAHETGIIHRDIKSDNVMVTRDGHPKILDFGLAKLLSDDASISTDPGSRRSQLETLARTQAGVIMGTVAYMSPEQARGLSVDHRSDIFSFGVVLYEMVTGKLPFRGESALDTMHAIAFEATRPVTMIRTDVPYALQRVIERCLQKRPEDRYPNLRQAADDLRDVKRQVESGVSGGTPMMERLRWWIGGLSTRDLVIVGAAAAITVTLLLWLVPGRAGEGIGPILALLFIGAIIYRRFRNRGVREVQKFVKNSSSLDEVRLIVFNKGQFTILADEPSPKTYVKLNAWLNTANERLFHGEPMTLVIREETDEQEVRRMLSSPGVQYVRDEESRRRRKRRG